MNNTTRKTGFGWGYLIIGILFIIVSLISFYNPGGDLTALAFVFAILAVLNGIRLIMGRRGSVLRLVAGILNIIIGVFLILNIYIAAAALPLVFAIWFIVESLFRLLTVGATRAMGTGYFVFSIIINILGIVLGILLLFNPITAALTLSFLVGFYLMLAGIECIVLAFAKPSLP
ncbi:MAG: hypothetical protein GXY32_00850 [Ruminococcaceae bacterium]|nr:hypothetical protein [Oscillospiraceae bacterium]